MTTEAWAILAALTVAGLAAFVLLLRWDSRRAAGQKIEHDDGKAGGA
jgi:hypothetical protein